MIKILFIAVCYRTPEETRKFVECFSRESLDSGRVLLIVVDNSAGGCGPWTRAESEHLHPNVRYVVPAQNLGYLGGARFGLSIAREQQFVPDWVVVSNVDLEIDPAELIEVLDGHDCQQIGVIAPDIRSAADGWMLNPYMIDRPARGRFMILNHLFRFYWGLAAYSLLSNVRRRLGGMLRISNSRRTAKPRSRIYAAHGCLFILSRGFFEKGGSLQHRPFLYYEELTIAETARTIGLPVVFEPTIHVEHFDHASTGALPGRARHRFISEAARYVAKDLLIE